MRMATRSDGRRPRVGPPNPAGDLRAPQDRQGRANGLTRVTDRCAPRSSVTTPDQPCSLADCLRAFLQAPVEDGDPTLNPGGQGGELLQCHGSSPLASSVDPDRGRFSPFTRGPPGGAWDGPLGRHDGRAYATSPAEPSPAGVAVPIAIRRGLAVSDSGRVNSNIPLS